MSRTASSKWRASSSSRWRASSSSRFTPKSKAELIKMFHKKYSTRSDHLPVKLEFEMKLYNEIKNHKAFTYNTSFASDLGLLKPYGSERVFLSLMKKKYDKRHYMKKAVALIKEHFEKYSVILIQEGNDADKIEYKEGEHDPSGFVDGKFIGGYQAIIRELAGTNEITLDEPVQQGNGSYYRKGTFGDYCYVAYSVEKILGNGKKIYPTVLTIWNKKELGEFKDFYGKDLGIDDVYQQENTDYDNIHHGRPFSCVRTTKGVNIINMHGPNAVSGKPDIKGKLEPTIIKYMTGAKAKFGNTWNMDLTIVGGDLNDTENDLKSINFDDDILKFNGKAKKTCCYEFQGTRQNMYPLYGDLLYAKIPTSELEIVHPFNSRSHSSDEDSDDEELKTRGTLEESEEESEDEEMQEKTGGRISYHILKKKKRKSIKKRHTIQYKSYKSYKSNKTNNSRKYKKTKKSNKTKKTKKTKNSRKQKQTKKNN